MGFGDPIKPELGFPFLTKYSSEFSWWNASADVGLLWFPRTYCPDGVVVPPEFDTDSRPIIDCFFLIVAFFYFNRDPSSLS